MRHRPFLLCPGLAHSMSAVTKWVALKATKKLARLHIGAYYLIREKRLDFNDAEAEQHLSTVGIYVKRRFPRGTLSGAACMDEHRLVSYPQYDHSWDDFCKSLSRTKSDKKNDEEMRQKLKKYSTESLIDKRSYRSSMVLLGYGEETGDIIDELNLLLFNKKAEPADPSTDDQQQPTGSGADQEEETQQIFKKRQRPNTIQIL